MVAKAVARIHKLANQMPDSDLRLEFSLEEFTDTSLLAVTDGVTEASSPNGDLFEMDRLAKSMTDLEVLSAQNLVQSVTKSVADFRQTLAQQDDITVFALVNRKIDSNKKL